MSRRLLPVCLVLLTAACAANDVNDVNDVNEAVEGERAAAAAEGEDDAPIAARAAEPSQAQDPLVATTTSGAAHVAGEVLVTFKAGATDGDTSRARARVKGSAREKIRTRGGEVEVISLPDGVSVEEAMRALALDPSIAVAEPNFVYEHAASAGDPYLASGALWGMTGEFGSKASQAWAAGGGDCGGVYVGIIDEGFMIDHEDLAANVGRNPGEIPGNRIDDDGNGYVDDVYGWDFVKDDPSVFDGVTDDHGTHVAGTIGAIGGNGKGVAGVCWSGVRMLSAKFLGRRGGTTANAIRAVDYFTDLKLRHGLPLVATNNSWGGGGYSHALHAAIERAGEAGILFVAAAGNSTNDNDAAPTYPASYPSANVIAVAALTPSGQLATFSSYGATSVDIAAPGAGIWSAVPVRGKKLTGSSYASWAGTSMAAPHVTGAAALYAGRHPGASAEEIKAAILAGAAPTPALEGKCLTGGRLDVSGF